ncbi:MAG: hypothetical protein JW909_03460 [Planctomycetes bacterium]|nr:hypothetical protein [Planctomycetota bacterium]
MNAGAENRWLIPATGILLGSLFLSGTLAAVETVPPGPSPDSVVGAVVRDKLPPAVLPRLGVDRLPGPPARAGDTAPQPAAADENLLPGIPDKLPPGLVKALNNGRTTLPKGLLKQKLKTKSPKKPKSRGKSGK